MGTIADSATLDSLIERLRRLTPETERRWGTMSSAEMLCHLGDANEAVLGVRVQASRELAEAAARRRPFMKWLALRSPMPWPKGLPTGAGSDSKRAGTHPQDFERDRERVITSLKLLAEAKEGSLSATHPAFGPMTIADWHAWASKHHDHHLSQFGV